MWRSCSGLPFLSARAYGMARVPHLAIIGGLVLSAGHVRLMNTHGTFEHVLPEDRPTSLVSLPAEMLYEIALWAPLRTWCQVTRLNVQRVACVRLQRWYRIIGRRGKVQLGVGDRVLVTSIPARRGIEYATAAAKVDDGSSWKVRTLDGMYFTVPTSKLRRLAEWVDGPWASSVGRSAALYSASKARGAAQRAAAKATQAMRAGARRTQTALVLAAASAASTAAAAATAASSIAAPSAANASANALEAQELLTAAHQVSETIADVGISDAHFGLDLIPAGLAPAAAPCNAAASALVAQAASAAAEAAREASAATSAAQAVESIGLLPVTASTVSRVTCAAQQVVSAVEALEAAPVGSEVAAVEVATDTLADMRAAGRALTNSFAPSGVASSGSGASASQTHALDAAQAAARVLRAAVEPSDVASMLDRSPQRTHMPPKRATHVASAEPGLRRRTGREACADVPEASRSHVPLPSREAVLAFLRAANPVRYGAESEPSTLAQETALDDAAAGIFAMMKAAEDPPGMVPVSKCPILWAPEDPQNTWALEGRFLASTRAVRLPLLDCTMNVLQRWRQQSTRDVTTDPLASDTLEIDARQVEGHSTAAVCWDGGVVLADFLCLPPPILLSHSPNLARIPAAHAGWRWADKRVLELGCGIAALPALVASLQGAQQVVCTDASESVLQLTRINAAQCARVHPSITIPNTAPLAWGDGEHVRDQLRTAGLSAAPFDVILAADCIYVLDNPGAWGKLMTTIAALATPQTLIFVTYTDRGHNKLWERFVAHRVSKLFHVVPVQAHLLHPVAQPSAQGRLEQHTPACQLFCWTLKDLTGDTITASAPSRPAAVLPQVDALVPPSPPPSPPAPPASPPSSPPSPPGSDSSLPGSDAFHSQAARPTSPVPATKFSLLDLQSIQGQRSEWRFTGDDAQLLPCKGLERTSSSACTFDETLPIASRPSGGPHLHESSIWRVASIGGKGLGLVAARHIRRGERIIAETPLALVTQHGDSISLSIIAHIVGSLMPNANAAFWELSQNEHKFGQEKTAEGVWRTNAYPIIEHPDGRKVGAVFAVICRINHACVPNAHIAWNKKLKQETVHAIKPIAAGDEITVSCTPATP